MTTIPEYDVSPVRAPRGVDGALLALRLALGLVFLLAGSKLILPGPFDLGPGRDALVASFTDPNTGWMAPWLVERITALHIPVGTFLLVQGLVEVTLAVGLIVGLATPRLGMMTAMMLVTFTIATPTGGPIRISRDIALAAAALMLAQLGGGHWSLDRWLVNLRSGLNRLVLGLGGVRRAIRSGGRDRSLLLIRLGMAYTLAASALFSGGIFDNPMNTSLPGPVLLIAAVLVASGLTSRYVMGAIAGWLLVVGVGSIAEHGLLVGLESAKREVALCVIAAVYAAIGPDRWSLPRPRRPRCREVSRLLLAYVDGDLPPDERRAIEWHLGDCPNCWDYLVTYRETVALGKELRDHDMPPEVYTRMEGLVRDRPAN